LIESDVFSQQWKGSASIEIYRTRIATAMGRGAQNYILGECEVKSAAWSLGSLLMELFVVRSVEENQGPPAEQVNFNKY
jgi:hypothetical protein